MTKQQIKNIKQNKYDGYEYSTIRSIGQKSLYGENLSDEEYEKMHVEHIVSDYEEGGYEVISVECEVKGDAIIANLYVRKKKQSVKKNANKIAYVERWMLVHRKTKDFEGIEANQLPNGKWLCEIELPLVNKTAKAVSTSEIGAMLNAAEKATKLIQEYLKEHPDMRWIPLSKFRHWKIGYDEHGLIEIRLDSDYRKKMGEGMLRMKQESIKAVEKSVSRIKRIIGTDKDLFIQVIDRSLFDKGATNDEIYKKIFDTMYDEHNIHIDNICCTNDGNHIIVIGYTILREEFEEYFK